MDTALDISGDFKTDGRGYPYMIADDTWQQVYILLSAKSGGFYYDRELGLAENDRSSAEALEAAARRVLRDMPGAEVCCADITAQKTSVTVKLDGAETEIELRRED